MILPSYIRILIRN
uniref:Uncharacterized protein n=1 Tax=Lotus japonicus TaxID=34305 RepID=I3T456_LOTJA|nr:unknown [Lotus japonicus]